MSFLCINWSKITLPCRVTWNLMGGWVEFCVQLPISLGHCPSFVLSLPTCVLFVGPSAWSDLPFDLCSCWCPTQLNFTCLKSFYFGCGWEPLWVVIIYHQKEWMYVSDMYQNEWMHVSEQLTLRWLIFLLLCFSFSFIFLILLDQCF